MPTVSRKIGRKKVQIPIKPASLNNVPQREKVEAQKRMKSFQKKKEEIGIAVGHSVRGRPQHCASNTKSHRQCKRSTCILDKYCWQHVRSELGVMVKKSHIPMAGKGLFALKDFQKGDTICSYDGKRFRSKEEFDRAYPNTRYKGKEYETVPDYAWSDRKEKVIVDAKVTNSSLGRYANQGYADYVPGKKMLDSVNAVILEEGNKVVVKAVKNLKAEPKKPEEVLVDYSKSYWDISPVKRRRRRR